MRKEDLKASFDQVKPSESAKKRMIDNIMNQYEREKGIYMPLNLRKAIPAFALAVVILGGLLTINNLSGNDSLTRNNNNSNISRDLADYNDPREDAAAPVLDQFQIGNRYYVILSDELREDFGLPAEIDENDIGEKLTEIAKTPDASLMGKEVYSYIPAGGEAIVAVKKGDEYQFFRFFTFESYNNNQDEDAIEYLKLYGINKAGDIAKIRFILHSERSKIEGYTDIVAEITDREEISRFYSYYSALKNSSDKYFETLFNSYGRGSDSKSVEMDIAVPESGVKAPDQIDPARDLPEAPADKAENARDLPLLIVDNGRNSASDMPISSNPSSEIRVPGMVDMGNTGSGSTAPGRGSALDALANPVTIRIYNQNGVYFDSPYYRNIGFISRYEVSADFEEFIAQYLN